MQNKLIYLASVYSLESTPEIRQQRYERVLSLIGLMIKNGLIVFSPIVYNHPMALKYNLDGGWDFWKTIDSIYINRCDYLFVLKDDGWDRSVGITEEVKYAKSMGLPIKFVLFDGKSYLFEK